MMHSHQPQALPKLPHTNYVKTEFRAMERKKIKEGSTPTHRKTRFSPEQDLIIRKNAEAVPKKTWAQIAELVPGKNAKQCRERYQHFLSPELNRRPWTTEEDYLLATLYEEFGHEWAKIVTYFPGRTNHDVKNRWNGHLKNKNLDVFLARVSRPPHGLNVSELREIQEIPEFAFSNVQK